MMREANVESIETAARRLREAYGVGQIQPLRAALDPLDATKAYAIQAANTRYWTSLGRRVIGRKVDLTAKAVQQQLGVDQPDFGVLGVSSVTRPPEVLKSSL
jgi:2-keto-4-pentenoate hydratase